MTVKSLLLSPSRALRRIPIRFTIFALVLVGLNTTGLLWIRQEVLSQPQARLRVMSVAPLENVDQADRFELVFDDDVVSPQRVGEPVDRSPFEISPRPAGSWRWAGTKRLVYLLEDRLPPGKRFEIKPTDDAEIQTGCKLVGETTFEFKTKPLKLTLFELKSEDQQHVSFELGFNQSVSPGEVARHVKVRDRVGSQGARILEPAIVTRDPAKTMVLRVPRPRSGKLNVTVDQSLTGHGAELPLGRSIVRQLDLKQPFVFRSASPNTPGVDEDVSVRLRFSTQLDRNQPLPAIHVTPAVKNLTVRRSYNTLYLNGSFESAKRYSATIPQTLLCKDGRTLGKDQVASFTIPDREPELAFLASRGLLMPTGNLKLDLRAVNVKSLELQAWRVHENNIVNHLRHQRVDATARQLAEKKVRLDLPHNKPQLRSLDIPSLIGDKRPGVYRITARASNRYWARDNAVVSVTDLGLTIKKHRGGFLAWVTSLATGQPVRGVVVQARTYSNQKLAQALTNGQGIATIAAPDNHPDGPPWVIIASKGNDLNFIQPDRRAWVLDHVDQSGRSYASTYDAMLYTERGVYRPGDTIHVTGIIREPDGKVPPAMPLQVRVTRPDGKTVAEIPVDSSKSSGIEGSVEGQGMFHVDFLTDRDSQLGQYRFDLVIPGSKKALGRTTTLVEAFMPVRIELNTSTKALFGPNETPKVDVDAQYLFGQPAAQLPVKLTGRFRQVRYKSKRLKGFSFGDPRQQREGNLIAVEQSLDGSGVAALTPTFPKQTPAGLWRLNLVTTVSETGGRSVSSNRVTVVDKVDRHLGIKLPNATGYLPTRKPFVSLWRLVDGQDGPIKSRTIQATLHRIEYDTVIEQVNGRAIWKSKRRLVLIQKQTQEAGTTGGDLTWTCPSHGQYELVAQEAGQSQATRVTFYAAGNASEAATVSMNDPQRLELVLDREEYAIGDVADVLVRGAFKGTLLLTTETNRVLSQQLVQMDGKTAQVRVPVTEAMRGGCFVGATVIRPIDASKGKWLPHRAMGLARIRIDHASRSPKLAIEAPSVAEPGQKVNVAIAMTRPKRPAFPAAWPVGISSDFKPLAVSSPESQSKKRRPTEAHVWAVDDGILLTTAYQAPDPAAHFLAPRRSSVVSSDVFGDLLPDHRRPSSMVHIGADSGEFDKDGNPIAMRRSNPVATRHREPAVVWRSRVTLDASGRAIIPMVMPRLTGRMRIMAVLVDGDRYASAERPLVLRSDLQLEPSFPRFVAPGDVIETPIKIFNNSDRAMQVTLKATIDGDFEFDPIDKQFDKQGTLMRMLPRSQRVVWFKGVAKGVGPVTVRLKAVGNVENGGNAEIGDRAKTLRADAMVDFAARPVTPIHSVSNLATRAAGEVFVIHAPKDLLPKTATMRLRIGGDPKVQMQPAIRQLLDYPYGCVEQTTSRLYAILLAPRLIAEAGKQAEDGAGESEQVRDAKHLIRAGIDRLWSMQTRSGGLGYWPGARSADLWGTAYAAGFLVRARAEGFTVDTRFTAELGKYLQAELSQRDSNEMDANMRAQLCRVLVALDLPQRGWMNRLGEDLKTLDMAGRANLASAWIGMGRKDKARALLVDDGLLEQRIATTHAGRLTSQIRQEAVLLNALLDLAADHPWAGRIAQRLNRARSKGHWGTTVNTAAVLHALSRYQTLRAKEPADFTGSVITSSGRIETFGNRSEFVGRFKQGDWPLTLRTGGQGKLYVSELSQGLAVPNLIKPYDRNLKVRRRWLDRQGNVVDPMALRVGDLIQVKVDLQAAGLGDESSVQNMAIVDLLPAGVEVENPRLRTSASHRGKHSADRVEFLDDRVLIFATATHQKQTFEYAVRVIQVGKFVLPPIQASCMYDPAIASMHGQGEVVIRPGATGKPDLADAEPVIEHARVIDKAETRGKALSAVETAKANGD